MPAYASIDDVLSLFETRPKDARAQRLEGLIEVATEELIAECGGRDYLRHPAEGSSTWLIDGTGLRVLHAHEGIISLDSLEYSDDAGLSFTAYATTDYELRGADYSSTETTAGQPYFHVVLFPTATRTHLPFGTSTLRATGVRGWPVVPRALVESTAQRVRQLAYGDATYAGSVPGPSEYSPIEYAQTLVAVRWPQVLWNFLRQDRLRFLACSL